MNLETNPIYGRTNTLLDKCVEKRKPGVFIEGGANIGGNICAAREMMVHAFEPVPDVFERLISVHSSNLRCRFNRMALSDKNERIENVTVLNCWTIASPEANPTADIVPEYKDKRFDVQCVTLDDYRKENGFEVSILKLDVDGYELRALRGSESSIWISRPYIAIEFSYLMKLVPNGGTPNDLVNYILEDLEYDVCNIEGNFRTHDRNLILENFPYHTSFDVMLIPREDKFCG